MTEPNTALRHSLLIRIVGAMTIVVLVVLAGMGSALIIAETTRGNASAINLAGSLRMQSYRLSTLAFAARAQPNASYRREIDSAIAAFDQSLNSPVLINTAIIGTESKSAAVRQAVVLQWQQHIQPMLRTLAVRPIPVGQSDNEMRTLLEQTNSFVANINRLVTQIEQDTESRIHFLRTIIIVTLLITLGIVFLIMYFLHAVVLTPLRSLLAFTIQIRHGNLNARTPYIGEDELGRLGQAFNFMAEDLSKLYAGLEQRVLEKTADLERSNRSLELLYHSIARLYSGPVEAQTYMLLLREIETVLELGAGSACLVEAGSQGGVSVLASTLDSSQGEIAFCSLSSCAECMAGDGLHLRELGGQQVLSIPLRGIERVYGVMQLIIPRGREIEPWKLRLLEALSRHIGTAIGTARRAEHERVLALLEERSVMARELHDSLAQSLAYMKIQVSRLGTVIGRDKSSEEAGNILRELREGLNSAYRQLRELLTTFRLRIEGESLSAVLDSTVQEFTSRGQIQIALETHLTNCSLSANEEIHILQIVREALSNVIHHAQARHAKVFLCTEADDMVSVSIEDDGMGINHQHAQTHHYGMAIMEERARGLGGRLEVMTRPAGGTRIEVRFLPVSRSSVELHHRLA